jgi:multidrug efflux pump subunit AcrB
MWLVRLGLRRPYTFIVAALLIVIFGAISAQRMPTDIFPVIDLPVISMVWSFGGIPAEDMERRVVTVSERSLTTTVNDIEHIESQSLNGVSVIKVFFHEGAKIEAALAQINAISNSAIRVLPPGITPPTIIRFNASNVPILQVSLQSSSLSEQEVYDYGYNFMRTQLATVQGASIPLPYGGRQRQIMIDLDLEALYAKGLGPNDVVAAVNAQNLILPAGFAKMGDAEYAVRLNSSPDAIAAINDLPIRAVNGATVYLRDVAQVRDGYAVQSSIVRENGRKGALLTVLKAGGASTLDVVRRVKEALPTVLSTLPKSLEVKLLADQSVFVRSAINGVLREAVIAACLTALMILLFLGSWRSTLIVALSIPLAILTSVIALAALGQTVNVMTLGGLALAVGILVDDATVAIENIHRVLEERGGDLEESILEGASQIAIPTFVSTLAICIVFVPVFFLTGVAKYLFGPLAMGVIFAMLASYLLSRTLVPLLVKYAAIAEHRRRQGAAAPPNVFQRFYLGFERGFDRLREQYGRWLALALAHRRITVMGFSAFAIGSLGLVPFLGRDFFPSVDAGQIRLHVRAPAGTRIEVTDELVNRLEHTVRRVIPPAELVSVLSNVGLPSGGFNLAFSDNPTIGATDADILISLDPGHHAPTERYITRLRRAIRTEYPGITAFFLSADIVGQILNFGLPAPIDVQVVGQNRRANYALARSIAADVAKIPGAVDVRVHQVVDAPELLFAVDRTRAGEAGLTQRDVANHLLTSLSSSQQVSPNFWVNPQNGVNYPVAVQTPTYRAATIAEIERTPITGSTRSLQLLSNLASTTRHEGVAVANHYNVQPVFDVFLGVQGRDLGAVAAEVDRVVAKAKSQLARGSSITMRGQVQSMRASFAGLGAGIAFAIVLVYLLMVVNFQSWLDPFIIVTALPGALAGIAWTLFVTQTTLSVPSLMGAIMSVGVATANSILVVTFANGQRAAGRTAIEAAHDAGVTRLRPVLMTALAMVIGMLPMALGFGEGGEQNAPLGRAVVGGLAVATVATLFAVPVIYSVLRSARAPVVSGETT